MIVRNDLDYEKIVEIDLFYIKKLVSLAICYDIDETAPDFFRGREAY